MTGAKIALVGHRNDVRRWARAFLRRGCWVHCQAAQDLAGRRFEGYVVLGPPRMADVDVVAMLRAEGVRPLGARP